MFCSFGRRQEKVSGVVCSLKSCDQMNCGRGWVCSCFRHTCESFVLLSGNATFSIETEQCGQSMLAMTAKVYKEAFGYWLRVDVMPYNAWKI
eukprot:1696311-Pleurochrysis_carterae.AAC.4